VSPDGIGRAADKVAAWIRESKQRGFKPDQAIINAKIWEVLRETRSDNLTNFYEVKRELVCRASVATRAAALRRRETSAQRPLPFKA